MPTKNLETGHVSGKIAELTIQMTNLSVNVNKIAWLRNARGEGKLDQLKCQKF